MNQPAKKPQVPVTQQNYLEVSTILNGQIGSLEKILPNNLGPERFVRTGLSLLRNNNKLMLCDPNTFCLSIMRAAELGLSVSSGVDEAYIIPYGQNAEFQIGYRGWLKLAMQHPDVQDIYGYTVFKGDTFSVKLGSTMELVHEPSFESTEAEKYYAVVKFKNGSTRFEVMTKQQVEIHKNKYAAKNSPAWTGSFDAMALKTVLKKICKKIPATVDNQESNKLTDAIQIDDDTEIKDFQNPYKTMQLQAEPSERLGEKEEAKAIFLVAADNALANGVTKAAIKSITKVDLTSFIAESDPATLIAAADVLIAAVAETKANATTK